MKNFFTLTLILFVSFSIAAQDFAVDDIVIRSKVDTGWAKIENDTVLLNDTVYLGVVFNNAAGGIVSTLDSLAFGVSVGGLPIGSYGGIAGKNLPAGSGNFSITEIIIRRNQVFSVPVANVEICAWPVFWSRGGLGGSTANDTACATYSVWDRQISLKSFTPEEGAVGTDVTISGSYFGPDAASNMVKIGGETAVIKSASSKEIVATVPANGVSGKITVESGGLSATSATDFTVLDGDGNAVYPTSIKEIKELSAFGSIKNSALELHTNAVDNNLKVVDLTGKVVIEQNNLNLNSTEMIHLSELQKGIYIAVYGNEYLKFSK